MTKEELERKHELELKELELREKERAAKEKSEAQAKKIAIWACIIVFALCGICGIIGSLSDSDDSTVSSNRSKIESVPNQTTREPSVSEKLLTLSDPNSADRASVLRQFDAQIPALVEMCSDIPTQTSAGDKIVTVHNFLRDEGLDRFEPLPRLTNNLFRLTKAIDRHYNSAGISPPSECSEIWAMYAALRIEGQSPDDAIKGLEDLVSALTGL